MTTPTAGAHRCHAVNCDVQVPPKLLMCRRHWYMVPKPLRDAVWAEYRAGQEVRKDPSRTYLKVAGQAIAEVAAAEELSP